MPSFAEELKNERQRLGLTQAEAATALDVKPRTIWKWENDEPPLHLTQEGALARLRRMKGAVTAMLCDIPRIDDHDPTPDPTDG